MRFEFATSCEDGKTSRYSTDDVVSLGSENVFDFLDSDDMDRLSRVIEARCRGLNVSPESIDGQMVASQLFSLFQNGVTDEAELATRPIALEIIQRHE